MISLVVVALLAFVVHTTSPSTPLPTTAAYQICEPTAVGEVTTLMTELSPKLSPGAKQLLSEPRTVDQGPVNVILRIDGALGAERRKALEAAGAEVRTIAGDVVTATIPAASVPRIAAFDYIIYIEVARPLFPEQRAPTETTEPP